MTDDSGKVIIATEPLRRWRAGGAMGERLLAKWAGMEGEEEEEEEEDVSFADPFSCATIISFERVVCILLLVGMAGVGVVESARC